MNAEVLNVKIKNGEAPVIKFGKGEKTLIILPGLSYDGVVNLKDAVAEAYSVFCEKYTVYLIERNLYPFLGYTIEDVADDAFDAATKLGIKSAYVFGVSMGGAAAEVLSLKYKDFVKSLVLGSTFCRVNDLMKKVIGKWKSLAYDVNALIGDFVSTVYSESTLKKYKEVLSVAPKFSDEKSSRFERYCSAVLNFDVFQEIEGLPEKTLVIGAAEDEVSTAAAAREIAENSGAEYFEYKTFGHAAFDEAPDYKQKVFDFFER